MIKVGLLWSHWVPSSASRKHCSRLVEFIWNKQVIISLTSFSYWKIDKGRSQKMGWWSTWWIIPSRLGINCKKDYYFLRTGYSYRILNADYSESVNKDDITSLTTWSFVRNFVVRAFVMKFLERLTNLQVYSVDVTFVSLRSRPRIFLIPSKALNVLPLINVIGSVYCCMVVTI